MKRWMLTALALLLCVMMPFTARAQSPFFGNAHWSPEDVDISGVQENGGRLTGEIKLPSHTKYGLPTAALYIDCAIPEDFLDTQKVKLHVTREADAAIGEQGNGHTLDGGYYPAQLQSADVSYDPDFGDMYAQAKAVTRAWVEGLGGQVAESVFHANRRDAAHNDRYSLTESSTSEAESAKRRARFEQEEQRAGRAACEITMVRGLFELCGLPVMDQYFYRLGDDWVGEASEFRAAVRDDGEILFAAAQGQPKVIAAEPMVLPELDWRLLLKNAVAKMCLTNAQPEDRVSEGEDGRIVYAGYSVITQLRPCWVGMTRDTLVPGWYLVTEQRVKVDDSVAAAFAQYGDAATLME